MFNPYLSSFKAKASKPIELRFVLLLLLLLLCNELFHPDQDQTCSVQTRSNMFSRERVRQRGRDGGRGGQQGQAGRDQHGGGAQ